MQRALHVAACVALYLPCAGKGASPSRPRSSTPTQVAGGAESIAWRHSGHRGALRGLRAASHVPASQGRGLYVSLIVYLTNASTFLVVSI